MDFVNYCSNKSASGLSISGSERRSKESSSPCKRLDRQKSVSYSYYTDRIDGNGKQANKLKPRGLNLLNGLNNGNNEVNIANKRTDASSKTISKSKRRDEFTVSQVFDSELNANSLKIADCKYFYLDFHQDPLIGVEKYMTSINGSETYSQNSDSRPLSKSIKLDPYISISESCSSDSEDTDSVDDNNASSSSSNSIGISDESQN